MARVVVCDVCEQQFDPQEWEKDRGMEMRIPPHLLGDVSEDARMDYDLCSWECVRDLSAAMLGEGQDEEPEQQGEETVGEVSAVDMEEQRRRMLQNELAGQAQARSFDTNSFDSNQVGDRVVLRRRPS